MTVQPTRRIGALPLLFTGVSSIIGSGWLFGAQRAATLAGPAAILAWVAGAIAALVISSVAAELGAMFPVSGGTVRYARATHGPLVGFLAAWTNWIALASVIPVEAEASIQYMSSWPYDWTHALYRHSELSPVGLSLAALLMVGYFLLNFWSVSLFARSNAAITLVKLVVPALTGVTLLASAFHVGNITGHGSGGFMPNGPASVLTAVAVSGIVFAYNGFQSPLNLAGEARNPDRTIPFAVLGSVGIAAVVYLLLQTAFLGAVDPGHLRAVGGWGHLDLSSPFAQLALALNLNWLAVLLYVDSFLSPSGTGITYVATTARLVVGAQANGTAPAILGRRHPVNGAPRAAMWFNLAVAFIFLFFFRGWGALAAVISVANIVTYLLLPVSALTLRRTGADLRRPVRLPGMRLLGPLAFTIAAELLYWARWPLSGEMILLLIASLPIYGWYRRRAGAAALLADLRAGLWLVLFLPLMALLSRVGSRQFGGLGWIGFGWDLALVAVLALVFCAWAQRSGLALPHLEGMGQPSPSEDLAPGRVVLS